MNIFAIIKNPIFKIVGVSAVLYFALFANKYDPESLGNRLSSENIKKNLDEAQTKTKFIATNIRAAKEYQAEQKKIIAANMARLSIQDIEVGKSDIVAMCGDIAEITYGLYSANNEQIEIFNSVKFTIGEINQNAIVQKNVSGMKQGGIRFIAIPQDFKSADIKLAEYLNFYKSDLRYQITLTKLERPSKTEMVCDDN